MLNSFGQYVPGLVSPDPLSPGAFISNSDLLALAIADGYEVLTSNYDGDGVVTTATVKWADTSPGVYTRTSKNSTFLTTDAYTISHTNSNKVVTQSVVTRNSNGQVTIKPALTVA